MELNKTVNKDHLSNINDQLQQGKLPQWIMTDPEIHQQEIEKIFSKPGILLPMNLKYRIQEITFQDGLSMTLFY